MKYDERKNNICMFYINMFMQKKGKKSLAKNKQKNHF